MMEVLIPLRGTNELVAQLSNLCTRKESHLLQILSKRLRPLGAARETCLSPSHRTMTA